MGKINRKWEENVIKIKFMGIKNQLNSQNISIFNILYINLKFNNFKELNIKLIKI